MHAEGAKSAPENPREKANFLSLIVLWWTIKIFKAGFKRDLEISDLYKPLNSHRSELLGDRISRMWSREVHLAEDQQRKPNVFNAVRNTFIGEVIWFGVLLFSVEILFRLHLPYFIALYIHYFSMENQSNRNPDSPRYLLRIYGYYAPNQSAISLGEACFYGSGIVFISLIYVMVLHPYMLYTTETGMKIRIALTSLMYRKSLRLSKCAFGKISAGKIVNILSNDMLRFDSVSILFHYIWVSPLQTLLVTILLYFEVGIAAVWGSIAMVIFLPFQTWLSLVTGEMRSRTAVRTDERIRQMNEIITGMQVIKMYAWEKPFQNLIAEIRQKEIDAIRCNAFIKGVFMSFIMFTSRLGIFVTVFVATVVSNEMITADKLFMITAHYMILRQSMTVLMPQTLTNITEAYVALRRIQSFMENEETLIGGPNPLDPQNSASNNNVTASSVRVPPSINLKNVYARWGENDDYCLQNINLFIKPGELASIIGVVGAGKSNVLNVILGELPACRGDVVVHGVLSYSGQDPWLFAGSVRQNILFGLSYDRARYKDVIQACALARDLRILPHGDRTLIGERGISLSGGQRARINLARAVYKQADIYLLDDPLSAVDTHVSTHIFNECILKYLNSKIRILITHQIQFLKNANHIIIMDKGEIKAQGSYESLKQAGLDFATLFEDLPTLEEEPIRTLVKMISFQSTSHLNTEDKISVKEEEEDRTYGGDNCASFKAFFKAGGNCCVLIILIVLFLGAQILATGSDMWITQWVNAEEVAVHNVSSNDVASAVELSRDQYVWSYSVMIFGVVIITLTRSFFFMYVCMTASINLHNEMFISICRVPMRFFNVNSSGRILNRFSKDLGQVDEALPVSCIDCFQLGLNLVGVACVVFILNYVLIIPVIFIMLLFYIVRQFYLRTSKSIKRLEGITKSPVFSHLNASLQGLTTIRVHEAEKVLVREFDQYQNVHTSAYSTYNALSRALGLWLDIICVFFIACVTYSFLFMSQSVVSGYVGLAITQVIGLTGMFQWALRQSTEMENQMVSVERILEYCNLEHEPPLDSTPDRKPLKSWPSHGRIEYRNVNLQYAPNENPVLHNLSFVINPQEKIGIVGRTGAGKSSLIASLFRLASIDGEINIDGVNTTYIGLHDLRSKISIIPQEPMLFTGTMRYNLDPFQEFEDSTLNSVLNIVELHHTTNKLGMNTLDIYISEGGANFSVGQRQLVCLARAIIRKNRILVLDEATANVDPETDELIQKTLRRQFGKCTVITVAHRLNTVMDSDKILVMDAGCIIEFDHPHILLQLSGGIFTQMVNQTGQPTANILKKIAEKNYLERSHDVTTS